MLRSENTKSLISAFGLVGVTVAAGCILSSSYTFADDTVIDDDNSLAQFLNIS